MKTYFAYPYRFDTHGRSATTDYLKHVNGMIRQVLFTYPGERVNRPDFGSGLRQLAFRTNSDALATATEVLVRGSLERWLSEVIEVHQVEIIRKDSTLIIDIQYTLLEDGIPREEQIVSPVFGID